MKQTKELKFVKDLKKNAEICYDDCDIKIVAEKIIKKSINHIIITDKENHLKGIVTSFDITKAIAEDNHDLQSIVTKHVITTYDDEPISNAARKMRENDISALPVIDENKKIVGIITSEEMILK